MNFKKYFKPIVNLVNRINKYNIYVRLIIWGVLSLIIIFCTSCIWYKTSINKKSNDSSNIIVKIEIGSSSTDIANILKDSNVIHSSLAFRIFVKLNNVSGLQAGVYSLNQSMNVSEIISKLKSGIVFDQNNFNITFVEGKNMRWIAKKIASETTNTEDDVFNLLKDSTYIDSLIKNYWFLSDDIKQNDIYYPLEGYLFPDTYNLKNKAVTVKEIFKLMLDKMNIVLSKYKDDILNSKYSVHQLLTIASIIESEGIHDSDRKNISSVLYNRINCNMSLGSDVTTYYAIKIDIGERDLYQSELDAYNAYNTRGPNMNGKLPVGPICCSGQSSIEAAIYPEKTDYLYFVADKNGNVFFSKSLSDHNRKIDEIKANGNWIEFE
jgi:UPF0755 protein